MLPVKFALDDSIFLGRDDGDHVLLLRFFDDFVGVVASIREQTFGVHVLHQLASLRAISGGTFCNKDSQWQTMRIHGQMYLGVEPPFVRSIA